MSGHSPDEWFDAEGVNAALGGVDADIADGGDPGVNAGDPRIDGPLNDNDEDTRENNRRTKDTHRAIDDAAGDLDDEDGESADDMRFGTDLSSAAPSHSPTGYSPTQQIPVIQPQTPTPPIPTPPIPAPPIPAGTRFIKQDALDRLVGNFSPRRRPDALDEKSSTGSDSASATDRIARTDVEYTMREGAPLTRGQFNKVLNEAMDKVGIPEDKTLRSRWRELYQYMAQHESSRNPNAHAASNSDHNVRVSNGVKGPDGAPIHTSRGILQTVPGTFADFHVSGTSRNIYDPLASTAASMNYVINDPKFGVSADGRGLAEFAAQRGFPNGPYRGY